ncbi:MAG: hypothetical protein HY882_16030 [Deltaproteobacteria bacterium]|nr:hypothetical protein [Deltaproteobacteria bacterium]
MDVEEIWRRFQKHMGYTDKEMEIFRSDPRKVKMVTQTPEFVKCRVIAEVIESHGCHAQHRVGDRFVMTAGGQLIADQCPKRMCISALGPISAILPVIHERIITKSDQNFERYNIVQCTDVGLDKGGWGKILMKIYVEKIPEQKRGAP